MQPHLALVRQDASGVVLETGRGHLFVSHPVAGILRVRSSRDEFLELLPSFAVEPEKQTANGALAVKPEGDALVVQAEGIQLVVRPSGEFELRDGAGRSLGHGGPRARSSAGHPALDFSLAGDTRVFGAGDKTRGLNRRGQHFRFWNTDSYGWEPDTDPLYKSFPVFALVEPSGRVHGIFVDSAARATADIGKTHSDTLSYELDTELADDLDFYLLAADDPGAFSQTLAELVGTMPLPPRWALGYHQSKYGYKSEAEIRGVVAHLRRDRFPVDAVWLDIDYQKDNAPFTVNGETFPTFEQMVEDLGKEGTRTVVITDPHIAYREKVGSGYAPFDSGMAGDHFILADSHLSPFIAKVWPGKSVFPEFTRPYTRKWWGTLYEDFVDQGVAGFWNDMNEPATFNESKTFPVDLLHRLEHGKRAEHVLVHNAYGTLNVRATYEGVLALRPGARPFVLTRAASVGAQRYAASWTGDNRSSWPHLRATIAQLTNLGVSGFPFIGADVGGFVGCPEPELLTRWMEVGAFQPFFRNHAADDACAREPWVHGEPWESAMRAAVERRYRLMPYLYTVFEETARTGKPIMRPAWYEFPADTSVADEQDTFLVGASLLVAPRLSPGKGPYAVQLPAADWYDTETGKLVHGGGKTTVEASGSSGVRVFARAGSVIAEMPLVQSQKEAPDGALVLHVWPAEGGCHGSLYWDDGESFGYKAGAYRRMEFSCQKQGERVELVARSSGTFAPFWKSVRVEYHGPGELAGPLTDFSVAMGP